MTNLNELTDEQINELVIKHKLTNPVIEKKKGFFDKLFSRKNKKVEQITTQKQMVEENTKKQMVEEKVETKEIEQEKQVEFQNLVAEIKKETEEITPIAVKMDMKEMQPQFIDDYIEPSDYKIATFSIKVKNKNVGKVLSKIGEYATELDNMEQVEHCDLNIFDLD